MNNLTLISFGFFILGAFLMGFILGSDKHITSTKTSPIKAIKEKKELKREQEERDKQIENERIILENIDNYDGTGLNQQDLL